MPPLSHVTPTAHINPNAALPPGTPFTVQVTALLAGGFPVEVRVSEPKSVWWRLMARVEPLGCRPAEIVLKIVTPVPALVPGELTLVAVTVMGTPGIVCGPV
jgi:hypothetical protein